MFDASEYPASTPLTFNITMTSANTEYSQVLPPRCKRFSISIQGGVAADVMRFAYASGKVATPTAPYSSFPGDVEKFEDGIFLPNGLTLYFACVNAGKVAQIEAWV